MKNLTSTIILVILLATGSAAFAEIAIDNLQGEGLLVMEANTKKILFEQNTHKKLYPASTTKVLTVMLTLDHAGLEDLVTVGPEIQLIGPNSSNAALMVGEKISAGDLVYAMMLPSGNDAAYAAAVYTARQVSGNDSMPVAEALDYFSELMNKRARDIGAINSNFVNPDGYHHPDHYSTPLDLALIAGEALQYPFLTRAAQTPNYAAVINRDEDWVIKNWYNTNRLLNKNFKLYYEPATGLKTGTTSEAGANLIATAGKNELSLIAVVLKSTRENRFQDAVSLLEYGFNNFRFHQVVTEGDVLATPLLMGQSATAGVDLPVMAAAGYRDLFRKEDPANIELSLEWHPDLYCPEVEGLKAPLTEGQVLGKAVFTLDGEIIFESELLASKEIPARVPWEMIILTYGPAIILILMAGYYRSPKDPTNLNLPASI